MIRLMKLLHGLSFLLVAAFLIQSSSGFKYDVANILMVRLYPQEDLAMENFGRLVEWLEYNIAIGVRHFYIYDDAHSDAEAFGDHPVMKTYIADGYVTYHRLQVAGRVRQWTNGWQDQTYARAIKDYRNDIKWILWADMDEYIRLEKDKTLQDFIERQLPGGVRGHNKEISQFFFRCWFVSGVLANPSNTDLRLVEQYLWRENDAWEVKKGRTKLLTIASEFKGWVNVHKAVMRSGANKEVALEDGFLLHYWKLRSNKVESTDIHFYPTMADQWGDFIFGKLTQRTARAGVSLDQVSPGPFPTLDQQKTFDPETAPDLAGNKPKSGSRKKQLDSLHASISRLRARTNDK